MKTIQAIIRACGSCRNPVVNYFNTLRVSGAVNICSETWILMQLVLAEENMGSNNLALVIEIGEIFTEQNDSNKHTCSTFHVLQSRMKGWGHTLTHVSRTPSQNRAYFILKNITQRGRGQYWWGESSGLVFFALKMVGESNKERNGVFLKAKKREKFSWDRVGAREIKSMDKMRAGEKNCTEGGVHREGIYNFAYWKHSRGPR